MTTKQASVEEPADPLLGQVLDGQWKLLERLGTGAMGSVFVAQDLRLARRVAVKVLNANAVTDEALARFDREAKLMAQFDHENLVPIHAVGRHQDLPFIVMKWVDGKSLFQLSYEKGRPYTALEAAHVVGQLLAGLSHLHKNHVLHRDVKPSNVVVRADGHATLLDFGVARPPEGSNLTRDGAVVGTPRYMAPEQVLGDTLDGRCDLYAAGVILYELLTFSTPFGENNDAKVMRAHLSQTPKDPREFNAGLSDAVVAVVQKAMAKHPGDRFATAEEFRHSLDRAARGGALEAAPPPPVPLSKRLPALPQSVIQTLKTATLTRNPNWVFAAIAALGLGMIIRAAACG